MLAFTTGDDATLDHQLIPYDLVGSAAHARGLEEIGILSATDADQLVRALKTLGDEYTGGQFRLAPGDEDCHSAIERELITRLGDAGKKIHTGRSRNDQILTALRLLMRDRLAGLAEQVAGLGVALCDGAAGADDLLMPGYTHGQRAMPVTLAFWYEAHAESIRDRLHDAMGFRLLESSPLGAGAGFGVPLPLDRAYTAKVMGFVRVQGNAQAAQNSRGRLEAQFLNWLAEVGRDVEKLAQDLWLFSTAEFGFVKLADGFTTGSSLMPNKRNPDVLELLRATAGTLIACRNEVEGIIGKLPSGYQRDYQLTKEPLLRGLAVAENMLAAATRVVPALHWDRARMAAACTVDLYATHRAMALVQDGVPFRDAYKQAADELAAGNTKDWKTGLAAVREVSHVGGAGAADISVVKADLAKAVSRAAYEREGLRKTWEALLNP
jgi:argininosuccinate lyase